MKQIIAKKIGKVQHPDIIFQHNTEEFHNPTLEIWKTKHHYYQFHRESGYRRKIEEVRDGVSVPCEDCPWFKEDSVFVDEKEIMEQKEQLIHMKPKKRDKR